MAVNADFNRKHPRHKENGRFREKHGSDAEAVAYARRISDAIGHRHGTAVGRSHGSSGASEASHTRGQTPAAQSTSLSGAVKRAKTLLGRAKDSGASTKKEIDAFLHPKLDDHSVEELRAMRKKLAEEYEAGKPGSAANKSLADSIARLIEKKTA